MRARGFTLIELVVAMAVSLIAIAGGVALLLASHRSFNTGADERAVQETARVAMDELLTNLRNAGYGLEPTFVFDAGLIANTVMDRIPLGKQARFGGYCGDGACVRDSIAGPDELVFYSRDPLFERDVDSVGTNTLNLKTDVDLKQGQVLQVMCYGNSDQWLWAYVTIDSIERSGTPPKPKITLEPSPGNAYDFPFQNKLLEEESCFQGGTVRAFKIDRYRYHIVSVDDSGAVKAWNAAGTRPYLVLDQGLFSGGKRIQRVIAPDVEDLQVVYEFSLATGADRLLGATSGTVVTPNTSADDSGFNLAPEHGIPTFETPSLDPLRTTHHPANIRAVRVAFTVRTPRAESTVAEAAVPAVFNRPSVVAPAGYRRWVFESSAYVHNVEVRLPVFPTYDGNIAKGEACCPSGGTCDGNCGGG